MGLEGGYTGQTKSGKHNESYLLATPNLNHEF